MKIIARVFSQSKKNNMKHLKITLTDEKTNFIQADYPSLARRIKYLFCVSAKKPYGSDIHNNKNLSKSQVLQCP